MLIRGTAVLLLLLAPGAFGITLVRDGSPKATVVIADQASPVAEYAAQELIEHVRKATGAALPLARVSEVAPDAPGLVLVGPSELSAALGFDPDALPPEGYIIRATDGRLVLLGRDRPAVRNGETVADPLDLLVEPGTLWAVYEFLERELGIRWLWPGDVGTATPSKATLRIEDTVFASAPRLAVRRIGSSIVDDRGMKELFDRKGVDYAARRRMVREWSVWARRQRLGGIGEVYVEPTNGRRHSRHYSDHPDWFAMGPDGRRTAAATGDSRQTKLCVSNPEVIDALYREGIDALEDDPEALSFSATPPDGEGFCLCPDCRAMDDELDPRRTYVYELDRDRQIEVPWVAMSRRYSKVWNALAERLAQDKPDRYVGVWPRDALAVPISDVSLAPNIIVGRSGFNYVGPYSNEHARKSWADWERTGARLFLLSYFFEEGHGFPFVYARDMGRDFRYCVARGMIGARIETWRCHFATQGLNVYVLARLMADPTLGPGGLIAEYCHSGFGRAASAIRSYFDLCQKVTEQLAETGFPDSRSERYAHYGKLFGPEFVREARILFFRARQMEDDPAVLARIDFLEKGLDYAEKTGRTLLKGYEMAVHGRDPSGTLQAIADREAFMAEHGTSWAVHTPTLRWEEWDPSKSGYFGLDALSDLEGKNVFAVLADWRFNLDPEGIGDAEGWWKPELDARDWMPIKAGKWWESQGFGGGPSRTDIEGGYNGVAWYRKEVELPGELEGRRILIRFGAIDESGWVYVNGEKVAESVFHPQANPEAWVTPVEVDITDAVHFDRPNVIVVKVRDDYGAGGLWRMVTLHWER